MFGNSIIALQDQRRPSLHGPNLDHLRVVKPWNGAPTSTASTSRRCETARPLRPPQRREGVKRRVYFDRLNVAKV
jgi:hypothetical protein